MGSTFPFQRGRYNRRKGYGPLISPKPSGGNSSRYRGSRMAPLSFMAHPLGPLDVGFVQSYGRRSAPLDMQGLGLK